MTQEESAELIIQMRGMFAKSDEDRREDMHAMRQDFSRQLRESEARFADRMNELSFQLNATNRRVSSFEELVTKTKEHQSSSDLEAEARHAALIEDKARKELEMRSEIAALNLKFDTFTQPKNGSATPLTLAKLDENSRRRGAATWLAVVLAALGVAGKAADLVTSSAAAKPHTTQQVQP